MNSEKYNMPILFIVFNRKEPAEQVFSKIREIKPKKLYIAADGPRKDKPEEFEKCMNVREIFKQIDWDCEVHTKFEDENLGCRKAVSSAISWFFENVEEGIILEDDCLPSLSFFNFCEILLEKYRDDPRIMHISGSNFQKGTKRGDASYYFSKLNHIWGWATWRRAWQFYDAEMKNYPEFKNQNHIANIFSDKSTQKYWTKLLDKIHTRGQNTWDAQWTYAILSHNGICITPNLNMITNIGFGKDAAHTKLDNHKFANMQRNEISEIIHPQFILPDTEADILTSDEFGMTFKSRIKREILRILGKHST
jgi:hypothetical protein